MSQVEMKCLKSGALHSQFPDASYVIYMTGAEERHWLDTVFFCLLFFFFKKKKNRWDDIVPFI